MECYRRGTWTRASCPPPAHNYSTLSWQMICPCSLLRMFVRDCQLCPSQFYHMCPPTRCWTILKVPGCLPLQLSHLILKYQNILLRFILVQPSTSMGPQPVLHSSNKLFWQANQSFRQIYHTFMFSSKCYC